MRVNDELNLNLTASDIATFEKRFWGEVENAKEQLAKSLGEDVPIPATLIPSPLGDESAQLEPK